VIVSGFRYERETDWRAKGKCRERNRFGDKREWRREKSEFLVKVRKGVGKEEPGTNDIPFMAYNLPVFFSRTRKTFPTSPRPSNLIFWKLPGPTST
jgi:hypothetical protein